MGKITCRIGDRYGKLVVVSLCEKRAAGRNAKWHCVCDCGSVADVDSDKLACGQTKSCGCIQASAIGDRHRTHGASKTRAFNSWMSMRQRCRDTKCKTWRLYGGRGITVCERWAESFANFLADMGEPGIGMSLDRIDVNGNYAPENCRWATTKMQTRNKRNTKYVTFYGQRTTVVELCETFAVPYHRVIRRLADGWSAEDAVIKSRMVNGYH